jgi:hypothetical protein
MKEKALGKQLFRDRPWVKDLPAAAPTSSGLAIFWLAQGEAYFWTMADNMRESEAPHAKFLSPFFAHALSHRASRSLLPVHPNIWCGDYYGRYCTDT